jgi:tripartite-type tricarboxylate transporter receptor subunit TctC
MTCLLFTSQLGLKPKLIPYRGAGPALSDLIGDHVDFFCEQVGSVAPEVKENSIKGLRGVGQRALLGPAECALGKASRHPQIPTQYLGC